MLVLGIETTCDETACAVVKDGREILSNTIASQMDLHAKFGGVVPELASRRHADVISSVLDQSLKEAGCSLRQIDLICFARGPGLIGSILVGLNFTKGLAFGLNKPFIGVNHVEAHLYAALMSLEEKNIFPALGVVISGGHTALLQIPKIGEYHLLGQTQDDAIGEAFDKVGSLLGLKYPGGPQIEVLARSGDPQRYSFKAGQIKGRPLDFSFSGLKTAVLYTLKGQNQSQPISLTEADKKDIAASFQYAATSDVVNKSLLAAKSHGCKSIIVGGGVSQNQYLRSLFAKSTPIPIYWPGKGLSLDNGAMIAALGYYLYQNGKTSDAFDLEGTPRIPFS